MGGGGLNTPNRERRVYASYIYNLQVVSTQMQGYDRAKTIFKYKRIHIT